MEVVAFTGPTGTGKSHRASTVAHDYAADVIIDDGLLIKDNKIIAGSSAKYETNKIRSVKKAIFTDPEHAAQVKTAIKKLSPECILVLGTSRNMIEKIVDVLELPPISKFVRIQDVSTPAAISKARETRRRQNKHIVPVPKIELQPYLPNFMIDPLRVFGRSNRTTSRSHHGELSVVRPGKFSLYGKLIITENAIAMIVNHEALRETGIAKTNRIVVKNLHDAEKGISIFLDVTVKYGVNIPLTIRAAQDRIKNQVEYMTWMTIREVNISVRSIVAS